MLKDYLPSIVLELRQDQLVGARNIKKRNGSNFIPLASTSSLVAPFEIQNRKNSVSNSRGKYFFCQVREEVEKKDRFVQRLCLYRVDRRLAWWDKRNPRQTKKFYLDPSEKKKFYYDNFHSFCLIGISLIW